MRSGNDLSCDAGFSDAASITFGFIPPPFGLVVTSGSSILSWSYYILNTPVTFSIHRSTNGGVSYSPYAFALTTSYTDTNVFASPDPGNTYYYEISASAKPFGTSSFSNTASINFSSSGTPPNVPTQLTASQVGLSQSVFLNWTDNSSDETGFTIERSGNGVTYSFLSSVGANVTASYDNPVNYYLTYWYRVFSFNSAGSSSFSNTASVYIDTGSFENNLIEYWEMDG